MVVAGNEASLVLGCGSVDNGVHGSQSRFQAQVSGGQGKVSVKAYDSRVFEVTRASRTFSSPLSFFDLPVDFEDYKSWRECFFSSNVSYVTSVPVSVEPASYAFYPA